MRNSAPKKTEETPQEAQEERPVLHEHADQFIIRPNCHCQAQSSRGVGWQLGTRVWHLEFLGGLFDSKDQRLTKEYLIYHLGKQIKNQAVHCHAIPYHPYLIYRDARVIMSNVLECFII